MAEAAALCGRNAPPFAGRRAVIATMHGKEAAIAPALEAALGLVTVTPPDIDTDAFGTFCGAVARPAGAAETAIAKARAGMSLTGADIGIASEGTYGAHPVYGFAPGGVELIAFVDDRWWIAITESQIVDKTNFGHRFAAPGDDIGAFLNGARFPSHALIVRPGDALRGDGAIKGITNAKALHEAIARCAARSADGRALIETDMRAHLNPTRMEAIRTLAEKLASRLASLCPQCGAPGFGRTDARMGLPCECCGGESTLVRSLVYECAACAYAEERPRPDGLTQSSPANCSYCNP